MAHAKRRRFTGEYKQRILSQADQAKSSGGIGVLLRREGLYSSLLATWRRERDAGIAQGLAPQKRGPFADETEKLRRENIRLTEQLRKAEVVIDVQQKWPRCWAGRSRPNFRRSLDAGRYRTRRNCRQQL